MRRAPGLAARIAAAAVRAALFASAGTAAILLTAGTPAAAAGQKVRGIILSTHTDGDDWAGPGAANAMAAMRRLGANWVAIHPYAAIRADGTVLAWQLRGDEPPPFLVEPIREAHAQGLKIFIKPHLAYWGSPFRWRGEIAFTTPGEWERFWTTYRDWIWRLAEICREADAFAVGTELERTLAFEDRWREIVAGVRERTAAPVTYAANWHAYRDVPFWDALDAIGIQAYFPLVEEGAAADSAAIAAGWRRRMEELAAYSREQERPICFTELGYNRSRRAAVEPWAYETDGPEAERMQALCLRVALEAVEREPAVVGAFLWKWFPDPYPVGRNFQLATPRLMQVIASVWGGEPQP